MSKTNSVTKGLFWGTGSVVIFVLGYLVGSVFVPNYLEKSLQELLIKQAEYAAAHQELGATSAMNILSSDLNTIRGLEKGELNCSNIDEYKNIFIANLPESIEIAKGVADTINSPKLKESYYQLIKEAEGYVNQNP